VAVSKVSVAVAAVVSGRKLTGVRVALGAVAPTVIRSRAAEAALEGSDGDARALREAGAEAGADARPIDDFRSTADYRRKVVPVLLRRAVASLFMRPAE
jgi:carbon-monoxide dehydrogenase medium subunit